MAGAALVATAAGMTVNTILWVVRLHHPLPYWDQWGWLGELALWLEDRYTPQHLWSQTNEHRLLFPRLFFFVDYLLCGGRNVFLLTCTLLIQAVHAALLWRATQSSERSERIITASIASAAAFSSLQMENFVWGFQVQFVLVFFAATVAMLCIARAARAAGAGRAGRALFFTVSAAAACAVSNYSMGNGVLVWVVAIPLAVLLRMPRGLLALLVTCAVASVIFYFHDYALPKGRTDPVAAAKHPLALLHYVVLYLGSPVRCSGLDVARVVGSVGLLVAPFTLFLGARWRPVHDHRLPVLLAIITFVLATAAVTTLGRAGLSPLQALSPRYCTPVLIFWCCVIFTWFRLTEGCGALGRTAPRCVGILFVVALAVQQTEVARMFVPRARSQEAVANMLAVDVRDDALLQLTHPDPLAVVGWSRLLRANHLCGMTDGWRGGVGHAVEPSLLRTDPSVQGRLAGGEPIPGSILGWRVHGEAWDFANEAPVRAIVLIDQRATIVGLGAGRPTFASIEAVAQRTAWEGHVRAPLVGEAMVVACAVGGDGHLRPLCGRLQISAAHLRALDQVGEPLTQVGPRAAFPWEWNAQPPGTPLLADSSSLASWSGSDGHRGWLAMGPFPVPSRGVAVPFYTGPDPACMSLSVVEASKGILLATATDLPAAAEWQLWVPPLPHGAVGIDVLVVAADSGNAWGQWMAVGLPRRLHGSR